jgi:hypothetical protein
MDILLGPSPFDGILRDLAGTLTSSGLPTTVADGALDVQKTPGPGVWCGEGMVRVQCAYCGRGGPQLLAFTLCGHLHCSDCLKNHVRRETVTLVAPSTPVSLASLTKSRLTCPSPECGVPIHVSRGDNYAVATQSDSGGSGVRMLLFCGERQVWWGGAGIVWNPPRAHWSCLGERAACVAAAPSFHCPCFYPTFRWLTFNVELEKW